MLAIFSCLFVICLISSLRLFSLKHPTGRVLISDWFIYSVGRVLTSDWLIHPARRVLISYAFIHPALRVLTSDWLIYPAGTVLTSEWCVNSFVMVEFLFKIPVCLKHNQKYTHIPPFKTLHAPGRSKYSSCMQDVKEKQADC